MMMMMIIIIIPQELSLWIPWILLWATDQRVDSQLKLNITWLSCKDLLKTKQKLSSDISQLCANL